MPYMGGPANGRRSQPRRCQPLRARGRATGDAARGKYGRRGHRGRHHWRDYRWAAQCGRGHHTRRRDRRHYWLGRGCKCPATGASDATANQCQRRRRARAGRCLSTCHWRVLARPRLYGYLREQSERPEQVMNKTAKISALSLSILLLGAGAAQLAAAADEHSRPEAARVERPQARAAPGRPGGQVLDSRYSHGRYYPPVGTVRPSLPEGYRPYFRGGNRYYFSGGIWYAPRGPGFIVVAPPPGLVISVLPPYYSTVWLGGVPYYYADNVYYTWQPDQNGYAVVDPPDNADAPSAPPADATPAQQDLIIYPKNGQSKDQQ